MNTPAQTLCLRLPARSVMRKQPFALAKGQALRLGLDATAAIGCDAGCLWLTIDGDLHDYVLDGGDALLVQDLRPPHVVMALADSRLWILQVRHLPFMPEPWTRRAARTLQGWLRWGGEPA